MHHVIIPVCDVDYFVSVDAVSIPKGNANTLYSLRNGLKFVGIMGTIKKKPEKAFSSSEIVDTIIVDDIVATVVARDILRDDGPNVAIVTCSSSPLYKSEYEPQIEEMHTHLEILAQATGRHVELFIEDGKTVPAMGTKQILRIALGSPAPGYHSRREASDIFGVEICESNRFVRIPTPSVDMGMVVKNKYGEEIAQIVDDTIYLFLPTNRQALTALSDYGSQLFAKSLKLAWNAYLEAEIAGAQKATIRMASVSDITLDVLDIASRKKRLESDIEVINDEIREAQERLSKCLTMKRTLLALKRGLESVFNIDPTEAFMRLHRCEYFDYATITSDGRLHYITKPLTYECDNGDVRYLGRYGIRIQNHESIVVWSIDYPHSSGVIHPHVNAYGDICLGNVSESVYDLMLQGKETDAAILIMRLLAEGYDASLAEHQIEEWPTAEKQKRRKP